MSFLKKIKSLLEPISPFLEKIGNILRRIREWQKDLPKARQWIQLPAILSPKEKIFFFSFFSLFVVSFIFLCGDIYYKNTEIKPSQGGIYTEGIVGQPGLVNPIYANSDVDRDISQLIFSGLMKYGKNLEIIPDLAAKYEIEDNGKTYKFYIKDNLFWQDKTPLTVDDIIFTIKTIQNPDFKSPLQANWVGVDTEKVSETVLKLKLKMPYVAFLENCTLKILPKHILENVPADRFPFIRPIGSGPYKIKDEIKQGKTDQTKSLSFSENPYYFGEKPKISEIKFVFFNKDEDLAKALATGAIDGASLPASYGLDSGLKKYSFPLPRYFSIFFNQENSKVLADKQVRLALNYGTDKKALAEKIFGNSDQPLIVDSPILPDFYGFPQPSNIYGYDLEKAKSILDQDGFKDENKDNVREKITKKTPAFKFEKQLKKGSSGKDVQELQKCLAKYPDIYPEGDVSGYFGQNTENAVIRFQEKYAKEILEPQGFKNGTGMVSKATQTKLNDVCLSNAEDSLSLKISISTVDQDLMKKTAEALQEQWKALGVQVEIKTLPISRLENEVIKTRNYECLLFGEVLGIIPDPLPFWHSSQIKDPGLNLSLYQNKDADKLLEDIRKSADISSRAEKLAQFQDILISDAPTIFLYSPDYIHFASNKIKGISSEKIIDPSKRFIGIEDWYINTKRVWK